jgi:cation transport regulator ChaC
VSGEFVFGYGSLAGPAADGRFVAALRGHRRRWGVAMDNRRDLPGYKYYTDAGGGRPAVFVCFLDLVVDEATGAAVNGVCAPVTADALAALDLRERNYARVDVSADVTRGGDEAGRVWAYVGTDAGRVRFMRGVRAGWAVIAAGYLATVRDAFAALGPEHARAARASLDPGALPVSELTRHELP